MRIAALILAALTIVPALLLSSCGKTRPDLEVPERLKGEERKKAQHDISEEDRKEYLAAIDRYIAFMGGDAAALRDMYPDGYWEEADLDCEELIAEYESKRAETEKANAERFGDGYKITYDIDSEKNYALQLNDLKATLKENWNVAPDRIEKAYQVHITVTVKGSKKQSANSFYFFPVKIDGKWYLANETGGFN